MLVHHNVIEEAISSGLIESAAFEGITSCGKRLSKTFGTRTLPDGTKRSRYSNDIVFYASTTKLLTTVAALQCCERGQLSLDEDLSPLLPELMSQGVLVEGPASNGAPRLLTLQNHLTLRHLVTHTSGLVYDFIDPYVRDWRKRNPVAATASDVPSRFSTPFAFQPEEGWNYGPGLDWAGHLIETVTSTTLESYFRENILKPIGIPEEDISFFPIRQGLGDRMLDLNFNDPMGLGLATSGGVNVHGEMTTSCFGGQGAYGTVNTFISVLQSILSKDGNLLSSASVDEMFRPQLSTLGVSAMTEALEHGPMADFLRQGTTGAHRDFGLGGLLTCDKEDGGLGEGSMVWSGGLGITWFIDRNNGVAGVSSVQLTFPIKAEEAVALRAVCRQTMIRCL